MTTTSTTLKKKKQRRSDIGQMIGKMIANQIYDVNEIRAKRDLIIKDVRFSFEHVVIAWCV